MAEDLPEAEVMETEADEGEESCGELKMGHFSMLLDMILIDNDRLVVTCDRDEKVRISRFPHAFDIAAYCLGHTAFVMSLAYDAERRILMSGSGDCTLRLWTLEGSELDCADVLSVMEDEIEKEEATSNENGEPMSTGETDGKEAEGPSSPQTSVPRPAIQQLVYCSKCSLLVVAMYRSPRLLFYRITSKEDGSPVLEFATTLLCSGNVCSVSLHKCVLWVACQGTTHLEVKAYTVTIDKDDSPVSVEAIPADDSITEGKILTTLKNNPQLVNGQAIPPDPVPHLWKSTVDGNMADYLDRKRRRLEGQPGGSETKGRWGRHAKRDKRS